MAAMPVEPPVGADELLSSAGRLSPGEVDRFVADVIALRAQRTGHVARPEEAALLSVINEGLPPDAWQRCRVLKARRRAETLADDEYAELLRLSDQIEMLQARRVEALVALARLRNSTPEALMGELGIRPLGKAW